MNLVQLDSKIKERKMKVEVLFTDDYSKTIECSEFIASEVLPGYVEFWETDPDKLVCLINGSTIKMITPLVLV